MQTHNQLEQLQKEYDALKRQLIEAVGGSANEEQIEQLKRRIETIASQIRKIDVNRKL